MTGRLGESAQLAVGIDLGTTYSAVAWINPDGDPEIIPDALGEPLTPSVVGLLDGRPVVGAEAKAEQARGGTEVAHLFKRAMGNPAYAFPLGGELWTAPRLSALVLQRLKRQAEAALGRPVSRAVVTVPEYFTHPERAATLEAARLAGLYVPRIISEPTAAALAYGLRPGPQTRTVLVYDLGGGTFDITLVRIAADEIRVLGSAGNHELGGRDWDDRLAQLVLREFPAEAEALAEEPDALLVEVEKLKRTLSVRQSTEFRVLFGGRSLTCRVTREAFEEASRDLLEQTGWLIDQVLRDAELGWADIAGMLPVGGSTRMPMVQRYFEELSGRPPMGGIHPDHAVALGAAAQAAILLEEEAETRLRLDGSVEPLLRLDAPRRVHNVVAHSLGMIAENTAGDRYVNSVLLPRNRPIPGAETRPYQFQLDGSGTELLEVFLTQGETDDPATCVYLGRYLVTGFPPGARGPIVVDLTYAYDDNAMVVVTASEGKTGGALRVEVASLPEDIPQRFLEAPERPVSREPKTIYLAFDLSGSMAGHPLLEAQRAARAFVSQLDLTTTSVGLVAFSDDVAVTQQATSNATEIEHAIRGLTVGSTGYGNATHPFDELRELLESVPGRRFGVVLADGVWARQDLAVRQAQRCHRADIDIVAVGFGGADQAFLQRIASSTEQALFTDLGELTAVFGTIAREITEGAAAS
ncbi:molecular chaperone DnaK [Micromonospora qiuiae]|uniref:Molecular chaperone DnaK n=1 Tax=Micromonospora qiuiae TaxID=502268 RepID=A0ABQ4JA78_9ACTN|nr:Hsp70 family protein [Micromonospora qiuiae]GIJ27002.1 molecular chaperone DnaK [Micromonospora qiuiae]